MPTTKKKKTATHTWTPVLPSWTGPDRSHGCLRCGITVQNLQGAEAKAPACVPPKNMDRVLSVKNVKLFRGHDGHGFNASLYVNGKRVGVVIDTAHGGDYEYQSMDWDTINELKRWARVKTQNAYWDQLDILVGDLVTAADEEKRLKRLCKTKTVAKLTTDPKGQHSVWNQRYTPSFGESLKARYASTLVEIVNERFLGGK